MESQEALAYICAVKTKPSAFTYPPLIKYLVRLLRSKNTAESLPVLRKQNEEDASMPLPVLVCNLLVHILKNTEPWPVDSVKVFLDDSLYTRAWVDDPRCRVFVSSILLLGDPSSTKFEGKREEIIDIITTHLQTRITELPKEKGVGGASTLRHVLLTLSDLAVLAPVRLLAAKKIEVWLQNPSMKTIAKDLLAKVASLCSTNEEADRDAVDILLRMKLKSTLWQLQVDTISQLVLLGRENLRQALYLFISRERPNNMGKGADNMKILIAIFKAAKSNGASTEFARVIQDLALDYGFASVLETIVRRVVKQLTFDLIDLEALCLGMMQPIETDVPEEDRLDWLLLMTRIIWLSIIMRGSNIKTSVFQRSGGIKTPTNTVGSGGSVARMVRSPTVRTPVTDAAAKEDLSCVLSRINLGAIKWCCETWLSWVTTPIESSVYCTVVRQLLCLDIPSDAQITEHEKQCFTTCCESIPLHYDTLDFLIKLAEVDTNPLAIPDAIQIVETIVHRASKHPKGLTLGTKNDIVPRLFDLTSLSAGIWSCWRFWKVSSTVLVLAAQNPSSIGLYAWENIPTLRCLMQMLISGRYVVPPVDLNDLKLLGGLSERNVSETLKIVNEDLKDAEETATKSEAQKAEGILKSDPFSIARIPPPEFIAYLRNDHQQLGVLLRKSREPDFLMEMVQSSSNVDWIGEIVLREPETANYLPSECLCQLVITLYEVSDTKILLERLKRDVFGENVDASAQIVIYFMNCLTDSSAASRRVAAHVLHSLLVGEQEESTEQTGFQWLSNVTKLPSYDKVSPHVVSTLEAVLQRETCLGPLNSCVLALEKLESTSAICRLLVIRPIVARELLLFNPALYQTLFNAIMDSKDVKGCLTFLYLPVPTGCDDRVNELIPIVLATRDRKLLLRVSDATVSRELVETFPIEELWDIILLHGITPHCFHQILIRLNGSTFPSTDDPKTRLIQANLARYNSVFIQNQAWTNETFESTAKELWIWTNTIPRVATTDSMQVDERPSAIETFVLPMPDSETEWPSNSVQPLTLELASPATASVDSILVALKQCDTVLELDRQLVVLNQLSRSDVVRLVTRMLSARQTTLPELACHILTWIEPYLNDLILTRRVIEGLVMLLQSECHGMYFHQSIVKHLVEKGYLTILLFYFTWYSTDAELILSFLYSLEPGRVETYLSSCSTIELRQSIKFRDLLERSREKTTILRQFRYRFPQIFIQHSDTLMMSTDLENISLISSVTVLPPDQLKQLIQTCQAIVHEENKEKQQQVDSIVQILLNQLRQSFESTKNLISSSLWDDLMILYPKSSKLKRLEEWIRTDVCPLTLVKRYDLHCCDFGDPNAIVQILDTLQNGNVPERLVRETITKFLECLKRSDLTSILIEFVSEFYTFANIATGQEILHWLFQHNTTTSKVLLRKIVKHAWFVQ